MWFQTVPGIHLLKLQPGRGSCKVRMMARQSSGERRRKPPHPAASTARRRQKLRASMPFSSSKFSASLPSSSDIQCSTMALTSPKLALALSSTWSSRNACRKKGKVRANNFSEPRVTRRMRTSLQTLPTWGAAAGTPSQPTEKQGQEKGKKDTSPLRGRSATACSLSRSAEWSKQVHEPPVSRESHLHALHPGERGLARRVRERLRDVVQHDFAGAP